MQKITIIKIISTIFRFFTALVMLWASTSKLKSQNGITAINLVRQSIKAYQIIPPQFVNIVAYALPTVEIIISIMLIIGLHTRIFSILLALTMFVFIFGIIQAGIRGLQIDCGCFSPGGGLRPGQSTQYTFEVFRDLGFAILCIFVAIKNKTYFALDNLIFNNKS